MVLCKATNKNGMPCGAHATAESGYQFCFFHGGGASASRRSSVDVDLSKAVVTTRSNTHYSYSGRREAYSARGSRTWLSYETMYRENEIVGMAIDYYVQAATANGIQLIDAETGERDSDNVKIINELNDRINILACLKKTLRGMLIWGNMWGEMDLKGNLIERLLYLPPQEMTNIRDDGANIIEITQTTSVGGAKPKPISWKGDSLKNMFYANKDVLYSEPLGHGVIERIYKLAEDVDDIEGNIIDIGKFVSYPFRMAKVGTDNYPASEGAVTTVADKVEDLEPGDWLVTRHNVEIDFKAPDMPVALGDNYDTQHKNLIIGLGVPFMYAALKDADPRILERMMIMFEATVKELQIATSTQFEDQVFRRQFELKKKNKKDKKDKKETLVKIMWNPIESTTINVLDLTSMVQAGIIGIGEARRIVESMGYTLLVGEEWEGGDPMGMLGPMPDTGMPGMPGATPSKSPEQTPQPQQPAPAGPGQQPQPPSAMTPPMSLENALKVIERLMDVDKFEARRQLLMILKGYITFEMVEDE